MLEYHKMNSSCASQKYYMQEMYYSWHCYDVTNKYTHRIMIMFWYTNSYMFRALMVHHQGGHNCIKPNVQPFYQPPYTEISQFCQCKVIKLDTVTNLREFHVSAMLAELDVWFYTNVHSLIMGQWGPKHVGVCTLKHYCNSNEVCAFVGHIVTIESKCKEWQMWNTLAMSVVRIEWGNWNV